MRLVSLKSWFSLLLTILALLLSSSITFPSMAKTANIKSSKAASQPKAVGNLATLYSQDEMRCTMSFSRNAYGHVMQDGEIKNAGSDIDFDHYNAGSFSIGIEGGRVGVIVDAGTIDDLARSNGFSTSGLTNDNALKQIKIKTKECYYLRATPQSSAHANIRPGHIYLIRITDRDDSSSQLLVKLIVLNFVPGQYVTYRWDFL